MSGVRIRSFSSVLQPHYLEEYKKQGFGFAKCGEEARFALTDYEISGKKGAKMRMNINHATKGRCYRMPSTGRC